MVLEYQLDLFNALEPEFEPWKEYILKGTGIMHGKDRVIAFFTENDSIKDRVDCLKREYGTGGFSSPIHGEPNKLHSAMHSPKGHVLEFTDATGTMHEEKKSHKEVVEIIAKLLETGEYRV